MPPEFRATYRVQLNAAFTLDDAAALADYLAALGVSHLYCSPYLEAAPGSPHGYDVVNHQRVNEELGGAEAHTRLDAVLKAHGLGQVLDIVPNHMAIHARNPWWWDVLAHGPASRYAAYFDVDWDPPEARHSNEVLVPVLGDHYGRVLEAGEIKLAYDGERFLIRYYDHVYPVDPRSVSSVLASAAERCGSERLAFIASALGQLPDDADSAERRLRDEKVLLDLLRRLTAEELSVAEAVQAAIATLNADADSLDVLLELQHYRLTYWRVAQRELGYRRFFDITTLIGLRVESEPVFRDTHALFLQWLSAGVLDGLRVDHPDGLRDPEGYFQQLRAAAGADTWIVVEKILEPAEPLRAGWPVAGTTGYDFLNRLNGLFVDPRGAAPLTKWYAAFTGQSTDFESLVREKKLLAATDLLASDLNRLTFLFQEACERQRRYRDYTLPELREALAEVAAGLPVYRTYVRADSAPTPADEHEIARALAAAKEHRPDLDSDLLNFLGDVLLRRYPGAVETELALRFQQFTGPVMAKGVEDTAFYNYNRFISLNEVGGAPARFGLSVADFHRACEASQAEWPLSMLATSTHDTKRSEDVRARLNTLSEIPEAWAEAVTRWAAHNERHRRNGWPDRNLEYLLYQTLVGAWPIEVERVRQYLEKATREAKAFTSWTQPNAGYEQAVADFATAILADEAFTANLQSFVARLVTPGWINALTQTLLKLTAPGVPDLYQGTELWSYSLVDPDNRRPVDYALRRRVLAEAQTLSPEEVWARAEEGLPKLWLIQKTLAVRRALPEAFGPGSSYRALIVTSEHAVAFTRGEKVVTVTPRLVARQPSPWNGTTVDLPLGQWRNALTGDSFAGGPASLAALFARFPVALLVREER